MPKCHVHGHECYAPAECKRGGCLSNRSYIEEERRKWENKRTPIESSSSNSDSQPADSKGEEVVGGILLIVFAALLTFIYHKWLIRLPISFSDFFFFFVALIAIVPTLLGTFIAFIKGEWLGGIFLFIVSLFTIFIFWAIDHSIFIRLLALVRKILY